MSKRNVPDRNDVIFGSVGMDAKTLRKEVDDLTEQVTRQREQIGVDLTFDLPRTPQTLGVYQPEPPSQAAMFISQDFGDTWFGVKTPDILIGQQFPDPSVSKAISDVSVSSTNIVTIFGGWDGSKQYRCTSLDGCNTWIELDNDVDLVPNSEVLWDAGIGKFMSNEVDDSSAYSSGGIIFNRHQRIRWSDDAITWTDVYPLPVGGPWPRYFGIGGQSDYEPTYDTRNIIVIGSDLYYPYLVDEQSLPDLYGFSVSTDMGASWTQYPDVLAGDLTTMLSSIYKEKFFYWNGEVFCFGENPNLFNPSAERTRIYRSTDLVTWTEMTINSQTGNLLPYALRYEGHIETTSGLTVFTNMGPIVFDGTGNDWYLAGNSFVSDLGGNLVLNGDMSRIIYPGRDAGAGFPGGGTLPTSNTRSVWIVDPDGGNRTLTNFPWRSCNPISISQGSDGTIYAVGNQYTTPIA